MVVKHWSLPTLSDLFYRHEQNQTVEKSQSEAKIEPKTTGLKANQALSKAEKEWSSAIAATEELLLSLSNNHPKEHQGLLLSGPIPILSHESLISRFLTGVFTTETFEQLSLTSRQLPGASEIPVAVNSCSILQLPLLPKDPISAERYAILFTREFSLAIVLGQDHQGFPQFHFSFEPELILQIWTTLRTRLLLTNYEHLDLLDQAIAEFSPINPDYRIVTRFSSQLLKNLANDHELELKKSFSLQVGDNLKVNSASTFTKEIELLQALTHEIRTPLTTIRTLTRLLLKRSSQLSQEVLKRLEMIDQECTEQINRMELIFKATELEAQSLNYPMQLLPISLDKLFQENIPRWQKQSQRRNVALEVVLPQKLPIVLGDPAMLEQILTNLMEKITKDLSTGGEIRVQVTTVGNQLKLELLSSSHHHPSNPLKSLGQLLMFQPETGSLSLNMNVTKNLFNLMGGKLTVRQNEQKGEVLTIFLPLKSSYQVSSPWE